MGWCGNMHTFLNGESTKVLSPPYKKQNSPLTGDESLEACIFGVVMTFWCWRVGDSNARHRHDPTMFWVSSLFFGRRFKKPMKSRKDVVINYIGFYCQNGYINRIYLFAEADQSVHALSGVHCLHSHSNRAVALYYIYSGLCRPLLSYQSRFLRNDMKLRPQRCPGWSQRGVRLAWWCAMENWGSRISYMRSVIPTGIRTNTTHHAS